MLISMSMIEYIVVYLIAVIFAFLSDVYTNEGKENNIVAKILLLSSFISITLFVGLRHNVGIDFESYEEMYHSITMNSTDCYLSLKTDSILEPGYIMINYFCHFMGFGYSGVVFFMAGLSMIYIYMAVSYYAIDTKIKFMVISIFMTTLFFSSLNTMRQFLAIAILLYSTRFIAERKLKKYFFCIFIMYLFHFSALLMIPLYLIKKLNINLNMYIILSIVLYIMSDSLINLVLKGIVPVIAPRYSTYLKMGLLERNENYLGILFLFDWIFCALIIYRNQNMKINSKEQTINNIFILSIIGQIGASGYNIFGRFVLYFVASKVIAIPNIINAFEEKKLVKSLLCIFYIIYFIYTIYFYNINPRNNIVPYNSIFDFNI